jgi:hypothetical protein
MTVTERLLKAKHWQLFLLTYGIPIIVQVIVIGTMISSVVNRTPPDPASMFNYVKFFPLMMFAFTAVLFGWFWAVGVGLQSRLPGSVKMKTRSFRIFLLIPFVYILFISLGIGLLMNGLMNSIVNQNEPGPVQMLSFIGIIFPLHLFSMFCIFYCMYFAAKTFKTAELQREVTFQDFAGEFFLIWFFPIGVWIIQPKINRMAANN